MGDIAFAAGFASIRQFNATMLEVFDTSPTRLREQAARRAPQPPPGVIRLRLPYRPPIDAGRLFGFLAARAIPGVEEVRDGTYRRAIFLPNGPGILSLRPAPADGRAKRGRDAAYVECDLELSDLRDVTAAVQRCRRLLDLDADPEAVTAHLSADPVLGQLATACPGRRSPGSVDGDELAIRAVLGQQVSVAAARTLGARLVAAYGKPLPVDQRNADPLLPRRGDARGRGPGDARQGRAARPRSRASTLVGLAAALAAGDVALHPGADRDRETARLLALPGIGPWTAGYIRMRALSDPDAFPPTDAGIIRALKQLGHPGVSADGPDSWRPWRSYAVHHLWATLETADTKEHS